jgi:hypothetical protein
LLDLRAHIAVANGNPLLVGVPCSAVPPGLGQSKAKIRETFFVPLNARLDDPGRDFTRYPALAARNPTIVRSAMSSRIGVAFFEVERG